MHSVWQVLVILCFLAIPAQAQEKPSFKWDALKIQTSIFTGELGLLDTERDEYATNLADCAVLTLRSAKASPESLEQARRLLSLALHLSPRNRRAIVVNFQFSKGIIPETTKADFNPPTMARLLLARGQILAKSNTPENQLVARMFCHIAAGLDPKNEDAIYTSEVDLLDHGPLDWSVLTKPGKPPSGGIPSPGPGAETSTPVPAAPPRPPMPRPTRAP